MSGRATLGAVLAGVLAGCSFAPPYERPVSPVEDAYPRAGGVVMPGVADAPQLGAAPARLAPDIGWQEFFGDTRLRRLVELALAHNRDLRLAALNVEAARAQYRIQRADQFPTVDASAEAVRERIPSSLAPAGGARGVIETYSVGLGVSAFEIDLFGRVRSLRDAALAQYFATDEARKSAQLALVAAVANAYLAERAAEERLAIVEASARTWEDTWRLSQLRYESGVGSALDLAQSRTLVETARADLAAAHRELARSRNLLAFLVGRSLPADLPAPQALGEQALLADIPAGLPSALIERRPDILSAEQSLRAANADIGAARAALFPRITLTGALGTASGELSGLFETGSRFWSFGPQITLPIFDGGRSAAGLDFIQVRRDAAVAQYEQAIQAAFREVADGLAARATLDRQIAAQLALVEASAQRYRLSELRYKSGVESNFNLLDAQRSLYTAELGLLQTRLLRLTSLVDLYKALGGGWRREDDAPR